MINVRVSLKETSQASHYDNVHNTYEKGSFYCINTEPGVVVKFPRDNIWAIVEDYGPRHTHKDNDTN